MEAVELYEQKIKAYLKEKAMYYAGSCSSINSMIFSVYDEIYRDLFGEHIIELPDYGQGMSKEDFEKLVMGK